MKVLRTPEERFASLPDYDFAPRWRTIRDEDGAALRIHFVDEGPRGAPPVLLLHGEPTWSYLYRKMIRRLAERGRRVVAPDLVGFGKSDKPAFRSDYTYERHLRWLGDWLRAEDLRGITLFCQDWGGLLGLRLVAEAPERFARVVAANTTLPEGDGATPGFLQWLRFSQDRPVMEVGRIVSRGVARGLSEAEIAAYDAPFPDEGYKAGAHVFPTLVPIRPDQASAAANREAWRKLERFEKPFLTVFGDLDPILGALDKPFQERIPGARGRAHRRLPRAAHFLQEDAPEELADLLDAFMREG